MQSGDAIFIENASCYRHYHCPLSRTLFLGHPTPSFQVAEAAVLDGMEDGQAAARPGNR